MGNDGEEKEERISPQERQAVNTELQATIIVDERESEEYDRLLKTANIIVQRQTLSVGDFVLSQRLVVERKARTDFEASIIDGRLFEQAQRLVQSYERVIIVVEGEREDQGRQTAAEDDEDEVNRGGWSRTGRVSRAALLGAYGALVSDMGISLFFTKNQASTCELLAALAKHEQLAKKLQLRVMAKPKCLTIEQYQRALIECLPQVGPSMAKKLLAYFGTPTNILLADEKKLMEVGGLGPKKAKQIKKVLNSVWECTNGEE